MCPYFHFPVDDGLLCYISRGYQSLQDLNLNKESPENSKFCSSVKSACYAFTGEFLKELLHKYHVKLFILCIVSFLISSYNSKNRNNFRHLFLGFGIGEDYPFRPDHGVLVNETSFDANETTLETRK